MTNQRPTLQKLKEECDLALVTTAKDLIKLTLPELVKTKGCLGIVGSASGYVSTPDDSPYSMSKAAVRALSDTLYIEYKSLGVHVSHICPGFIESEIRHKNNEGKLIEGSKDFVPSLFVMPVAVAARQIVSGLEKRKREVVITKHAKVAVFVRQKFPWLYFFLVTMAPRRARKK